jgi:hypothetical protein
MLGTVGLWSESNAAFDWALEQFPGEGFIASTAIGKAIEAADWSRVDLLAARGGDRGLYADYIAGILRIADRLANGTLNAKRVLERGAAAGRDRLDRLATVGLPGPARACR